MKHLRMVFWIAIGLLAMSCTVPPGSATSSQPGSTLDVGVPGPMRTPTPLAVSAEVLTPIELHIGHGTRGKWFELYFTDPADPAGQQFTGGVDERLVQAIDSARLSVHLAMYSLSLNNVREALIRAHRRGVDVRLVTESDNIGGDDLQRLIAAGIPVLGDRRESTMHDKFMVIDRSELWTGSMNYTGSGVYADNNCLIRIFSEEVARAYESEFAEMFEDDVFGKQGGASAPLPTINIQGTPVEVLFAPDNSPESTLVNLLDTAQDSVDFLAFSFTSDPLGDAVLRAQRAGVRVQGVMDEEQAASNAGSELASFRSAGLDVRLDGNPGQMHDKVLIIDGQVVVLGSYNFSRSANESNDENLLVIYDRDIARLFVQEFSRIYAEAPP